MFLGSSLENSEAYYKLGIPVVKSILIHGVSGVGKKRLVKLVNEVLGCTMYEISIHDLLLFNEEEYDLVQFKKYNPFSLLLNKVIQQHIPATIVIHDLDALDKNNNKTTKILTILSEGIQKIVNKGSSCSVIVIGLACQLRSLPQSLQNSDIFGQHMLIPIPSR
ncbi:uncharacterized protein BX663DRAFT_308627 [Cokeromyces recurvatus]|uniref:uncharacterized protein n=1 Tax=Cokeromyces recurvatus TaxID=90255 RepID=UPI00221F6333|nr:uncharacterized protein BX663DRAFT_308627 [Cokeromyces recurvatus]KAI7905035.1 hypothetical protein BX663DRAFT_308627 [Cokeromyces recurvatus]